MVARVAVSKGWPSPVRSSSRAIFGFEERLSISRTAWLPMVRCKVNIVSAWDKRCWVWSGDRSRVLCAGTGRTGAAYLSWYCRRVMRSTLPVDFELCVGSTLVSFVSDYALSAVVPRLPRRYVVSAQPSRDRRMSELQVEAHFARSGARHVPTLYPFRGVRSVSAG